MGNIMLIARLLLALIFAIAGASKAADLAGTRKAVIAFGVPEKLASPLGYCLPFVEMLAALALLSTATAWPGAIAALALLLTFAAAIARSLIRGEKPDCNCFGQIHSRPVSWSLFVRNIALAGVAALVVARARESAGPSAFAWLASLGPGEIASLASGVVIAGLLGAGVIYLRRIISNQQTAFAAIEAMKKVIDDDYADPPVKRDDVAAPASGLPVGAPAPDFSLASLSNEQVTLDDLLVRGKPVLLLFVSANCGPCKLVLDSIAGWERSYHKQLTIALLTQGDLNANQDMARYRASHVLLQADSGVADLYRAPWTPAATLIGPSGRIAVKTTYGHEEINDMVTRAASMSNVVSRSAVAAGENLPGTSRPGRAPSPARTTGANGGNGHGENMRDTETRDEPSTFNLQPATNLQPAKIMGRSIRRLLFTIGEPAPSFSLEDLDGGTFSNEDLLGRDTLLLFWNPNCPYCRHTADDIADWEINPPKRAPRLVFVSSGSADSVRAESIRFKSLFLHDPELTVGALFGSRNTPSAVLIDSSGRIASSVQPGRVGVLALAGVLRPRDITTKVGEADPRDSLPPDTIFSNE